ncbi:DUF1822 family protein [Laspinema olomoucense]|uniref:DUF1822 family protein n=1 Tax=Laspinema olomoucense TaxID=3231600 RepID=UPI0021BB0271|nr:DUF1822 family protein [Laspinema sp. D3d]MCT7973637.1 DUF1822 family protein [Laspinema sp. D3d]
MDIKQIASKAAREWDLEKLSQDLRDAKTFFENFDTPKFLTSKQLEKLYGLLSCYSPLQLSKILNITEGSLRVTLTRTVYRYIETLVYQKTEKKILITWEIIPRVLEDLGYKRTLLQPPTEKWVKWRLSIEVSEISQEQLEQIQTLLQEIPGNASVILDKIEKGSIRLVFNGYLAGFERIRELFETGELSEQLGVTVLDVELEPVSAQPDPVNLSAWLENQLNQVIDEGWQTIDELFGMRSPAFLGDLSSYAKDVKPEPDLPTVQQGKSIILGTASLALLVKLSQESEGRIDILVRVFPIQESTDLPEPLKLMVLNEEGEILEEVTAGRGNNCLEQPLSGEPGEGFAIKLELGEMSATESFII